MSSEFIYAGNEHPQIRWVRDVFRKNNTELQNFIPAVDVWANTVAFENNSSIRVMLYCPDYDVEGCSLKTARKLLPAADHVFRVSSRTMNWLVHDESRPAIVSVCEMRCVDVRSVDPGERSLIVILDRLRMIGNIGCIIRSAVAAGADAVAYTNRVTRLNHPRLMSASHSAVLGIPQIDSDVATLGSWLSRMGFRILLADANRGVAYDRISFSRRTAIVLGSEHSGIDDEWYRYSETCIHIPMRGYADSLNVSAAGTVLLFAASKHMHDTEVT